MTVTPIAIADPPLRSAYGLHQPYALRTVLQLRSESGIVGIAEAFGGERALAEFLHVRDLVVGMDAYELTALYARIQQPRVFAAIEVAALDLIGKSIGRPLYDLLGGRVRDRVPFSAYLFYKLAGGGGEGADARPDRYGECLTPESIVGQAKAFVDEYGFGSLKLKAGVFDPAVEIETIQRLRDAFPSAQLRMDPNAAWSIPTALRAARELHGTLEYLEDPVAGIEGMGELHDVMREQGCSIPLASNVAVKNFDDLPLTVERHAAQIILGDHHYWGGPRCITHLGQFCQSFGIGLSMHSNSHLGVSLVAMTHVAAATPQMTYACDTHYPWQRASDEIVEGGRIPIIDGMIAVPEKPGLGVTLDYDQLARGRERYERCGYRTRDDAHEMRKRIDPNWKRTVPAW
jgi:glucarate dehydratase